MSAPFPAGFFPRPIDGLAAKGVHCTGRPFLPRPIDGFLPAAGASVLPLSLHGSGPNWARRQPIPRIMHALGFGRFQHLGAPWRTQKTLCACQSRGNCLSWRRSEKSESGRQNPEQSGWRWPKQRRHQTERSGWRRRMSRLPLRGRLKVAAVVSVRLLNTPATLGNRGGWLVSTTINQP